MLLHVSTCYRLLRSLRIAPYSMLPIENRSETTGQECVNAQETQKTPAFITLLALTARWWWGKESNLRRRKPVDFLPEADQPKAGQSTPPKPAIWLTTRGPGRTSMPFRGAARLCSHRSTRSARGEAVCDSWSARHGRHGDPEGDCADSGRSPCRDSA